MINLDYEKSGVNIDLGNDASEILYNASKLTWENRKGKIGEIIAPSEGFSSIRYFKAGNLPSDTCISIGFDGVGTKVEIAERINYHQTVAFDLFAMVCDDALMHGAEPVVVGSVLDVNSLENNIEHVKDLAIGYVKAARAAGVAVINGEIAELGARINGYAGTFNYNWGAGVVWFLREQRRLTGDKIKTGQFVVALQEDGFRSNGISLARKILTEKIGPMWHNDFDLVDKVLEPSIIYSKSICKITGGFYGKPQAEITGIAHITGGGIPGKLGRLLRNTGLGAELTDLYEPSDIMKEVQGRGKVSDIEAYKTFNMGQGLLIITPEPQKVCDLLMDYALLRSQIAGEITNKPGVRIKSKGKEKNKTLIF